MAKAAAAIGARMVHVSAIGADANSPSHYARAKAAGEKAVLAAAPSATILRPSVVFGPGGSIHQPLRRAGRMSPALPLIGGGLTKMQPVYVGDVATAVADAVDGKTKAGATYELGGPEVLTMREIMEIILATTERQRMLVPLPFGLAKLQALFLQFAPGPLKLTPDQVALLRIGQCGVGCGESRGPHAGRAGHHGGFARSDRAAIPLALPRRRAIPEKERVNYPHVVPDKRSAIRDP